MTKYERQSLRAEWHAPDLTHREMRRHRPARREMKRVATGRQRKPWPRLTDREKKARVAILAALGTAVVGTTVALRLRWFDTIRRLG